MCRVPQSKMVEEDKAVLDVITENGAKPAPKTGIDRLGKSNQLLLLALAMFLFFGTHNLLQEAMTKIPGFNFGMMLGYMEVLGVTVMSFLERKYIAKEKGRSAPLSSYPLLTICLLGSSSLSNLSLNYINFPTKVVFRSCKLVPTMLIATIINKRKFSSIEYCCAMAVCGGLITFAAADWSLTPNFSPIGIGFVSLSVVADAVLPNAQENLFGRGCTRLEVTFYSNIFTLIAMTFTTYLSGDLVGLFKLAMLDRQLQMYLVVYVFIAYIAISCFMCIVKRFGAVTGVVLSTLRKGMTIVLSFLFFPKAFSWYYVLGGVSVLGGILIASLMKLRNKAAISTLPDKNEDVEMQPLVK